MANPRLLACAVLFVHLGIASGAGPGSWPVVVQPKAVDVELGGAVDKAFQRGIERLSQAPYTTEWLLADVSFKVNRIFTNYSGDVSGRFIELAALTSPAGGFGPATLQPVLAEICRYQKPDGHFGLEMDLAKPMQKLSPPIPMLWGNARLLVGLVTAAQTFRDTNLLAAARRLGDFYVRSAGVFCSPAREAEFRATGTGGDGYACCYFPAIEGLAMLYKATGEPRYLEQARRMADWFARFDALPTDHSHGNLCAWRGILELFALTGERAYLHRALAKWETAVQDGYVWPLGGVGEHWYVFHIGDEGCSESDWLRFNLELWRHTGQTRFLEMAERLLLNQYPANQCPNGGYGWRHFEGDSSGPVATRGSVDEWNFCCSFHGPLGLHFLREYLFAGSEKGLFVNFPIDSKGTVAATGQEWQVRVHTSPAPGNLTLELELQPGPGAGGVATMPVLWIRRPSWALQPIVSNVSGVALPFALERGYIRLQDLPPDRRIQVRFSTALHLERRRFQSVQLDSSRISRFRDVAVLSGPEVLFAVPSPAGPRMTLLAQIESSGKLAFCGLPGGGYATVALPSLDVTEQQITSAFETGKPILLRPESQMGTTRRAAFMHDLVVVPADLLEPATLSRFVARARQATQEVAGPFFGPSLETRPDIWVGAGGWQFTTNGLRVAGGDVGLLDGKGYADYLFEFDLELPRSGAGIAGFVVRADNSGDCLMFQIQSSDSTYNAPEFKTRPNTLRPHLRRSGQWTIAEPIPLPLEIQRGQRFHVAVECRGPKVSVLIDGTKICTRDAAGYASGTVGFRATGAHEEGWFRNVALKRL